MHDPNVWIGRISFESARTSLATALGRTTQPGSGPVNSILIKINLCDYRKADSGATTDPLLLAALLDELRLRYPSARLSIIENDASSVDIWSAYRLLGFERVAEEHGAELVNVAEGEWVHRPVPDGVVFKELEIPVILETADMFINFAKLKNNALTKMTGCLKNIFALLRQKKKVVMHGRIDAVLQDMNKVIVPDVCLVDGLIGMETIGAPAFGRPKRCGLLLAARNPVAIDACAARVMGFRPRSIEHIKLCWKAGLGPIDYRLETDVEDFRYSRYHFKFEKWEYWLRNALRARAGVST